MTKTKRLVARSVEFVQDTKIRHSTFPDAPKEQSFKGTKIGNFLGHIAGVEVYEHPDETYTLVLRAEFTETWEKVPAAAVVFDGLTAEKS